ncbi:MAG: glycosyltransferase family 2 protein, partial [Candidatus Berkiella sp.]
VVVSSVSESVLIQALKSVLAQQFVREVIIVNTQEQASIEKALTRFVRNHPKCYIVRGHQQAGLAASYNLGAQHACGQYLLFMKANCVLAKNATAKLLATGILKPTPWLIGAPEKPSTIVFKPLSRIMSLLENSFGALKYESQQLQDFPEVSLPGGGFHAASISPECLFLSAQSFLDLKGLDKKCFHSTFHKDLCLRIHFAGGGVYRAREFDVITFNANKPSSAATFRDEWQAFRGRFHFYQKYAGKQTNKFFMLFIYGALALGFISRTVANVLGLFLPKKTQATIAKQTSFN